MLADNLGQQTWSDFLCLKFEVALTHVAQCETLCREIDNRLEPLLSIALFIRGLIYHMQGQWGQALLTLEEAIHHGRDAGFVMALTLMPAALGALLREIGQADRTCLGAPPSRS